MGDIHFINGAGKLVVLAAIMNLIPGQFRLTLT